MKISYFLGGIASLGLGIFLLWYIVGKFKRKVPDELGFNAKGILAGVGFIMIGVYLIAKAF